MRGVGLAVWAVRDQRDSSVKCVLYVLSRTVYGSKSFFRIILCPRRLHDDADGEPSGRATCDVRARVPARGAPRCSQF